jgi:hypothetical protein
MSAHTPGPWFVETAGEATDIGHKHVQWLRYEISAGSNQWNHESYCLVGSISNANNSDQNQANARLIAAAPDLLEALRDVLKYVDYAQRVASPGFYQIGIDKARAAIAKVTGSAQ